VNSEENIETINFMVDMIHEWKVSPIPEEHYLPTWNGGRVAFVPGLSVIMGWLDEFEWPWDIWWLPVGTKERVVFAASDNNSISKETQHPDEAWELLKFTVSDKRTYASMVLGSVPVRKDVAEAQDYSAYPIDNQSIVGESMAYISNCRIARGYVPGWQELRLTIFDNEIQPAMNGTKSVEECLETAQEMMQAALDHAWEEEGEDLWWL
jgi:multiple sugar transport system substrate-binding protein